IAEKKTAEVIDKSPLPTGLSDPQQQEYQIGLKELSKEYETQSLDFAKLRTDIENKYKNDEETKKQNSLLEIAIEKWKLPDNAFTKKALNLFDNVSSSAAFIYLDVQVEKKNLSPKDFYKTRSFLLIKMANTQPIRDLILAEFKAAGQQELIDKWKEAYL
ncbi:MAG: hypothetical protein ACOYOK_13535, partial [Pseudobdellovibrionaceae bacterium]